MREIIRKILTVLNNNHKKKLIFIFLLVLFGVFFEVLGIGLFIPIVTILVENDLGSKYSFLEPILKFLDYPSRNELLIFSLLFLLVTYLVKNFFLAFLIWNKASFSNSIHCDLANRLLVIYFYKPYNYFLNKNSAELIRNIITETSQFGRGFIISIIDILVEGLVLFCIFTLLIFYNPLISIISFFVFSVLATTYYFVNKQKMTLYGYKRQKYDLLRLKYLNEIFDNIKFLTVIGKRKKMLLEFFNVFNNAVNVEKKRDFIQQLPRLFFEIVLVFLFCTLIFSYLFFNLGEMNELLPTLVIFAVATYRMMPSINKILLQFQNIRNSKPSVDLIYNQFISENDFKKVQIKEKDLNFEKISFKNIFFSYEGKNEKILDDITFEINKGKIYGFVGPTGQGKSTLMDIIMCLQRTNEGKIIINDQLSFYDFRRPWQKLIGYVPQNIFLSDASIKNNIAFGDEEHEIDLELLNNSINSSQLKEFIESLDKGIETLVGENGVRLSGGQRQRLGIARALYLSSEILILDEVTSSLDLKTESQIIEDLEKLKGKKTILIVTHRLSTTKICDEIYKLEKGNLIKL